MKRATPVMFASVILFIPMILFAQTGLQENIPLHHFQLSCNTCHVSNSIDRISNNEDNTNVGNVKGDINKLCTSSGCHDFEPSLNHPVGIKPKDTIPKDMPLDDYSRITCLTCHDDSESSDTLNYFNDSRERLLSRPEGIQFCASCHTEMGGTKQEQSHWQFTTRAHLGSINLQSTIFDDYAQIIDGIDLESRTCLSCHDDVLVNIPPRNETRRQRALRWRDISDHPIGMNYNNIVSRQPGDYKPLFDQEIRLFNGKVGCGSCHNFYSQPKKNPVMRNQISALCLKCHNR
jgi:predicted CXXCH cytochrome family protein